MSTAVTPRPFGAPPTSRLVQQVPGLVERLDDDAAIVESVVRLAGNVGLDVVAEGVENTKQARFLRNIGCTFVQGYLYGPEVTPAWRPLLSYQIEVLEIVTPETAFPVTGSIATNCTVQPFVSGVS